MPQNHGLLKYIFTEKLLKKMLGAPPPGYTFEPRLVSVDQNGKSKAANSAPAPSGAR